MSIVDKLKSIFFEEEEEEEIEDTRPLKKITKEEIKEKEKDKEVIAKKVEIPKRRHVEEDDDDVVGELKFEPPTKSEEYVEIKKEEVKKEPKINDIIFDDEDFILDTKPKEEKNESQSYKSRERDLYTSKDIKEDKISREYKAEKPKTFTPSPIISPIYGILDKNYKKEEVKEKKEVRLTSRAAKMDLDSVRNKAFGDLENELFANSSASNDRIEISNEEIKKAKGRIEDEGKAIIDRVTLGEADEYYSDLGLAYNTDYKDASKEINDGRLKDVKEGEDRLEDNLFDLIDEKYERDD